MEDPDELAGMLVAEVGLSSAEANLYLKALGEGELPLSMKAEAKRLMDKGMVIVSGDDRRLVPVHPRLAVANTYRTWREAMVREINERRMRVDKLILKLIPVYEDTIDKRRSGGR
jgi:hypothetical protein